MTQERCATPPDEEPVGKTTFALNAVSHRNQPGCSEMVRVDALVTGEQPKDPALLLWGEGAGDGDRPENMSVEVMPPSHVHRMYFAQLIQVTDYENAEFTALSPVITFDVPADASCQYGNIILNFKSQTRAAGETPPARLAAN
jgi:hypothetical protein